MQGLYGKAVPHTRVEEMAEHYLREIRTVQAAGPYYLGGYCFGGLVAFEMAQSLRRQGEDVALLALFNAASPGYIYRHWYRPPPARSRLEGWREALSLGGRESLLLRLSRRVRAGFAWRARVLRQKLWNAGIGLRLRLGLPLSQTQRDTFFLEINLLAEQLYEPVVYPGPMVMFRGRGYYDEPAAGWDGMAAGGIEDYEIPGEHERARILMSEPTITLVAEHFKGCLARAGGSGRAVVLPG
jgi:thioesterase domain-containing protein